MTDQYASVRKVTGLKYHPLADIARTLAKQQPGEAPVLDLYYTDRLLPGTDSPAACRLEVRRGDAQAWVTHCGVMLLEYLY